MPFETRLFIKTGLVYLLLTFVVGATLLALEAWHAAIPFIVGVEHGHLGFVGWLVNVVIGVALWMFPLDRSRFPDRQGRYPSHVPMWCFGLLNVGLVLRLGLEPPVALGNGSPLLGAGLILSGLLQLAAIVLFVSIVWHRTRGPRAPAEQSAA